MDTDKSSLHMKPVQMRLWAFVWGKGSIPGVASPETCATLPPFSLCGIRERDGLKVVTTHIVRRLEQRLFQTRSGTIYRLVGPPCPDFAAQCIVYGRDPLREDLSFPTNGGSQ